MSIDRVATNGQMQYLLNQIMQASSALNTAQAQVASGKVSTDYTGIGDKTSILEAARSVAARSDGYQAIIQLATDRVDLQNTHLTSISDLANQLRQALTEAVANNDGSTLTATAGSVFDQLKQILNTQDAYGNYLYGGGNDNKPPLTVNSLSDLVSLGSASQAFGNGTIAKSIAIGDRETVKIGVLASDAGQQLMSVLKDIADFNAGANGNFGSDLTQAQADFLTGEIQTTASAGASVNQVAAANGLVYKQLQDAGDRQQSLSTLYKGFVSDIEDVDMGEAVSRLNQNQVALQAALEVTSRLNQISLLNYLPTS